MTLHVKFSAYEIESLLLTNRTSFISSGASVEDPVNIKRIFKVKLRKTFIQNPMFTLEGLNVSEYKIKPISREELPPTRTGIYDKVKADLEDKEKGIYEINMEGRKALNITNK